MLSGFVVGHDALVDLAGEEAFQAADDVLFGEALGGDERRSRWWVGGIAFVLWLRYSAALACRCPPRYRRCLLVCAEEAGIGQVPQSLAYAASERIRSGLSPNTMRSSAAESAPMPKPSRSVGEAWAVRSSSTASWERISVSRFSQRRASALV